MSRPLSQLKSSHRSMDLHSGLRRSSWLALLMGLALARPSSAQEAGKPDPAVPPDPAPSAPSERPVSEGEPSTPTDSAPPEAPPAEVAPAAAAPPEPTVSEGARADEAAPEATQPEATQAEATQPEATQAEANEPAAPPQAEAAPGPTAEAPEAPVDDAIEVVVAGSNVARIAGSAHVIGKRQLERFEYDDAAAILQQVPGVHVRQEDGVGLRPNISMRGVNPDRSKKLTLMEDGVLFGPAPYSAPAAYYFPMMTRMVQVRVVKGPGAIAYGPQTVGGAIDLVTRSAEQGTHGGVDLALGQYLYNKEHAYFSQAGEQVSFLMEGLRVADTGFKDLPGGGDTGFTRSEWMGKVGYVLDPKHGSQHQLSFKGTYSEEASNETYLGQTDQDMREAPLDRYEASRLDRMENHRTSLVLGYTFEGLGKARPRLSVQVYRHDFDRTWRKFNNLKGVNATDVLADPENPLYSSYYDVLRGQADSVLPGETILIGPNHRTFASQGIQTLLTVHPRTGPITHNIEGGVRLHNDWINRHHSQDEFLMQSGSLVWAGTPTQNLVVNKDETNAVALHLLDALEWGRLVVTPGIRLEVIQSRSDDYLANTTKSNSYLAALPGVGAYYGITEQLGVLAGAYRGFSPSAPGSTDAPESSVNYEGGARYQARDVRAEVIGFYNDYSNLTDICTLASGCTDENLDHQYSAGAARIYGLEMFLRAEPRLGAWSFPGTVAYTLSQGEFLTNFESQDPIYGSVTAGDHIPYLPENQLNVTLAAETGPVGASAAVTYVSRMREVASSLPYDEVMSTDEQIWADFGAYYRPLPWLEIYANLRNAFDGHFIVSRRPYGARPNAPRWFQMGVKAKF
jgi:Fe(3+) dicitrate transport protein